MVKRLVRKIWEFPIVILMFRIFVLFLILACGITPLAAKAEIRIALVVGNGSYSTVSSLDNPARDAKLMANTLKRLGFEVSLLVNSNQADLRLGISQFGRDLRNAGRDATVLFYYAGHGVQSFGTNYLLPVDIDLIDTADLDLVAIEAASVLQQMKFAKNQTNIVILDACRNNPFENIPTFDDNGLAEMNTPTGTFLSYATAPGEAAFDGAGGNSPFTSALANELMVAGVLVEQMFKKVRVAVFKETGGLQTPWDASSLTADFIFAAGKAEISISDSSKATRAITQAPSPEQYD
ncbi:MAG: putative caspase-like protein [Ascidiaceihabitans sp.]